MANRKLFTEVIKNGYSFKGETIKIGAAIFGGEVIPELKFFFH